MPHVLALSRKLAAVFAIGTIGVLNHSMPAAAGGQGSRSSTPPAPGPLGELADLVVQRINLADIVAAAKFGTPDPIDDPAREEQVLDSVVATARRLGVDPVEAQRFFRDQIEANKVVQRGLYALWDARPELRPTVHPDLATQVRPEIDRLTLALLEGLRASAPVRHAGPPREVLARVSGAAAAPLDPLHREALGVALRSLSAAS